MSGYRSETLTLIHRVATGIPLSMLFKLTGQTLILPVYHLASDADLPHIKHLYPIKNRSDFREDLDFLLRHFQPIDLSTLIEHVQGGTSLKRPSFFLSFDDGLREFYTEVAPILYAKGVPATNFINSAFIDNKELFFRYKVSLLMDQLHNNASNQVVKEIANIFQIKHPIIAKLNSEFLNLRYSDLDKIDEIAQILNIDFIQFLNKEQPYMTSVQIKDLINQGFTFGAHSIDHPMYFDELLSEQIRQTEDSVAGICEKFNLDHRVFAFPFTDYGVSRMFFDHFYQNRQQLDLSFGSAGLKQDIYPQHLQRIPMEMGKMTAQQIIHSEYFYYFLKGFVGKNQLERS